MNYLSLIKRYKLVVAQRYIFLPVNEIKNLQNDDYFTSRKYDGQLWYYVKEKDYSKIINVSERDISKALPALLSDLDNKTKQHKNLILAGELYFSTNDRERNGDVSSSINDVSRSKNLKFGVFDVVFSEKLNPEFSKRYDFLLNMFDIDKKASCHAIEQKKIKKNEIEKYFTEIVENEKGEGVILRNNTHIYKIKKEETIDAVITGYTTEEKANEIRSVSFGVFINQNEIMHIGSSGNFSDLNLKKSLFNELISLKINSNFQKVASNGAAYTFVKPKVVLEVKLLEFQADKSNDEPVKHVKFEVKNEKLNATGKIRSVSILGSSILRLRDDKKANEQDCGLNQISRITGLSKDEFKTQEIKNLPESKIIQKEVYKKESKKGIAIRKFVFWKSNKEKVSDYPSFLCYYLDYSEGRKDPMRKKIYPFNDEKLGSAYFKKLMDENVKKGWDRV